MPSSVVPAGHPALTIPANLEHFSNYLYKNKARQHLTGALGACLMVAVLKSCSAKG